MQNYFVRKSLGALFMGLVLSLFVSIVSAQNMFRKASDFDGDGKADYAVTRNEGGFKYWWIWQTTAGLKVVHWGVQFDRSAASDYDGDGKTDIAVYREPTNFPPTYTYYILQSQTGTLSQKTFTNFGNFGSVPAHQDYNGDGRADAGVQTGEFVLATQLNVQYSGPAGGGFGTSIPPRGIVIRFGDMDGGGSADVAYCPYDSNVVTIETNPPRTVQFGISNDRYLMADFDGDGKGELALWRPADGTWWWIRSSDNVVNAAQWGIVNDTPVPADYDGDGKTDLAIYRRESPQSHYWIYGSSTGVSVVAWGSANDFAVGY